MKKLILRALLSVALAVVLLLPATAETYTGSNNWQVSFNGNEMVSNFKTSQMDEAISAMQPGDKVLFTVALRNDSQYITEWYMTNKVLRSLEESQTVANGGAYTYLLTYTDTMGSVTTLFNSDSIGGEKSTAAGVGLHEATDSLKDYFFMDEVTQGEFGHVDLAVSLEGETQGNTYQDTLAQLQMNFAVELSDTQHQPKPTPTPLPTGTPAPGSTPTPVPTNTPNPTQTPEITPTPGTSTTPPTGGTTRKATPTPRIRYVYKTRIPQTSDPMNLTLIAAICGVSGLVLLVIAVLRIRKSKKNNHGKKPDEK